MHINSEQLKKKYDCIIIGGGFYGCIVAEQLAQHGHDVLLLEKEPDLMQRASYVNQARIHQGYHYPRSILTSLRSRVNFSRFIKEFEPCVYKDFDKYYAIGKISSKVTASQFQLFCERIGAPCGKAPEKIRALFNQHLIDAVFKVKEYAFDATKLKGVMLEKLDTAAVSVLLNSHAKHVSKTDGQLKLDIEYHGELISLSSRYLFNCSYSKINRVLKESGLPLVPLKHELTEMALIEMPDLLKKFSVTVMDGPFFSVMPFPTRQLHTLSHVRYTPHQSWQDNNVRDYFDAELDTSMLRVSSHHQHMLKDAQRYLPLLQECNYVESLWEIKTVLPQSETDDSRPILFKRSEEIPGLMSIMGGKIDNIYDVKDRLDGVMNQVQAN